jgi:3-oxoacyl-[acyl-carrier protein] reductase
MRKHHSIGAACARDLFSLGAHLALTYSKNLESIQDLVKELSSLPSSSRGEKRRISIHQVDLASKEDIARLLEEVSKEHGGRAVDILISNAGYGKRIVDISWVSLPFPCVLLALRQQLRKFV